MQEVTYGVLIMLLGLAALMYTAHLILSHRLVWRLGHYLTRTRRRETDTTRKDDDHAHTS